MTFRDGCDALAVLLQGPARREVVAEFASAPDMRAAMTRLAASMRAHQWRVPGQRVTLAPFVQALDRRTRAEGFHVLHDWDGVADKVNEDIIPLDVLHYSLAERADPAVDPVSLAVLLDYYVFHLLALCSVRVWDEGDANENLDRLGVLLDALQSADGSGQRFADDAETLLLLATSHFELEERGYASLLDRVRTLDRPHQLRIATGHASSVGSHLRFGFEATYGRDTTAMRRDNVADYPWLTYALETLVDAYTRDQASGSDALLEAILNGLSADPDHFVHRPWLRPHAGALARRFEGLRPSAALYSPLSFFFNFSHNVVKGAVIDALLWGEARAVSFNDLLTALPRDGARSAGKITLARTLMAHARSKPHRIRGRLLPVIVYDTHAGRLAFGATMRALRA
jgi:hypothetical protein